MARTKNPHPKRFVSTHRQSLKERQKAKAALIRRTFHREHIRATGREQHVKELCDDRRVFNVFNREALRAAPLMVLRRNKDFLAERAGYGKASKSGEENGGEEGKEAKKDEISEQNERVKDFEREANEILKRKEAEKKARKRKGAPSVEDVRKQIKYMVILHCEAVNKQTKSDYPIMLTKQKQSSHKTRTLE